MLSYVASWLYCSIRSSCPTIASASARSSGVSEEMFSKTFVTVLLRLPHGYVELLVPRDRAARGGGSGTLAADGPGLRLRLHLGVVLGLRLRARRLPLLDPESGTGLADRLGVRGGPSGEVV